MVKGQSIIEALALDEVAFARRVHQQLGKGAIEASEVVRARSVAEDEGGNAGRRVRHIRGTTTVVILVVMRG